MAPLTELHDAQDDVGAYAERFGRTRLPDTRSPARIVHADSRNAVDVEALNDAVDECIAIDLRLGLATVRVEYILIAGCPLVQGATVNGAWVDVDCFAQRVSAGWRRDIERARGAQ